MDPNPAPWAFAAAGMERRRVGQGRATYNTSLGILMYHVMMANKLSVVANKRRKGGLLRHVPTPR